MKALSRVVDQVQVLINPRRWAAKRVDNDEDVTLAQQLLEHIATICPHHPLCAGNRIDGAVAKNGAKHRRPTRLSELFDPNRADAYTQSELFDGIWARSVRTF